MGLNSSCVLTTIHFLTTAKLDVIGQRWLATLVPFTFILKDWSGKSNINADALSRINWPLGPSEQVFKKGLLLGILPNFAHPNALALGYCQSEALDELNHAMDVKQMSHED